MYKVIALIWSVIATNHQMCTSKTTLHLIVLQLWHVRGSELGILRFQRVPTAVTVLFCDMWRCSGALGAPHVACSRGQQVWIRHSGEAGHKGSHSSLYRRDLSACRNGTGNRLHGHLAGWSSGAWIEPLVLYSMFLVLEGERNGCVSSSSLHKHTVPREMNV